MTCGEPDAVVSGGMYMREVEEIAGDRIAEAVAEAGAARVSVSVEPVEAPEPGEKVDTPEGRGTVVDPAVPMPDHVVVELDTGGTRNYRLGDLRGCDP